MCVFVILGLWCVKYPGVSALGVQTHRLVNIQAAHSEAPFAVNFDSRLRSSLGFADGRTTTLRASGKRLTIEEWLAEGGEREDDRLRFLRHFHDPLQPLETAGLDLAIGRYPSAMRWMQDANQGGVSAGDSWSWRDARRLYYGALTEPDPVRREALWADVFRAIGQIMHLVADASVPEHARNDMHVLGALKLGNSYERWVAGQHGVGDPLREAEFIARYLSAPIGFLSGIFEVPLGGEGIAEVPVARLIDADRYDGSNPSITVDGVDSRAPVSAGLAEIANANFFSEDTLRGSYPSPTDAGLIPVNLATPLGRVRRYLTRPPGQGLLPANPLRAECATDAFFQRGLVIPPPLYPCMDGVVWSQVAAHMLPRAVGYARGVLDYFFRGSAAITGVEWTSTGITVDVQNTGTEEMEGVFEIYARHQPNTPWERRVKLATLEGGEPILLGPGQRWRFALPLPPALIPTSAHVLVFRGRLGLEKDGVVGQTFTVPYVEVRQTSYDADVAPTCDRPPAVIVSPPYLGTTPSIRFESMRCEWRVVNHRVSGTLETNAPVDPDTKRREPVIDRIEARWIGGDVRGPAPLALDGVPVGSVWQRQGTEPDPATFTIVDPTDRSRSYLYLLVTYTTGGQIEAQLAIFTRAVSVHGKQIVLDNRKPSTPEYLVISSRSVSGLLAYNWATDGQMQRPLFAAISHGGVPAPTNRQTKRRFGGSRAFTEGLLVDSAIYVDDAIDDFELFSMGDAAFDLFAAIEPLISPHPNGPSYAWVAAIRRVYQPIEREFLRAFVTTGPEPFLVSLTGEEVGE